MDSGWATAILGGVVGSLLTLLVAWFRSIYAGWFLWRIARKRHGGIKIRNRGWRGKLEGDDLEQWLIEASDWIESVPKLVRWYSLPEGARIRDLDTVDPWVAPAGTDPRQIQRVQNISATLKRLDSLLERHVPRY